MRRSFITTIVVALLAIPGMAVGQEDHDLGTEAQREAGKVLYDNYCAQCHGDTGEGDGEAADYVRPIPRDFTSGKFKVRSTPSGQLPTHQDLEHIIEVGMPYTAMQAWPQFSREELRDVTYYVKSLVPGYGEDGKAIEPIEIPEPPQFSDEGLEEAKQVYEDTGCARCHGEFGRSDGRSAPTLENDRGQHIPSADLTKPWTFRAGSSPKDIFRTISTGFNGTPMPGFTDDALSKEKRWQIVQYILSLSDSTEPNYAELVSAVPVAQEIEIDEGLSLFEDAPMARFPIIGQIVQPGRAFNPSILDVEVRAVHNGQDVAILVQWNDMRAETDGTNSPTLQAPTYDEFLNELSADEEEEESDEGGGFWGVEEEEEPEEESSGDFWGTDSDAQEEEETGPRNEFSDAVALQFPTEVTDNPPKPYFIFGDSSRAVDLWFLDLAAPDQATIYGGKGTGKLSEKSPYPIEVWSQYEDGRWSVIYKRASETGGGLSFAQDSFVPVAFSVWDGFNRERGNRRGLTGWYSIYVEPLEKPSPVRPMVRTAALALIAGLVLVLLIRRQYESEQKESREYTHTGR